jgi:hypothetical protein
MVRMPDGPLRVLLTNARLTHRGGTQVYVRDVALELLARGHTPIAYSTRLGEVASEMRLATIPVVDDLDDVGVTPDVIHGHHSLETMTALLHFPNVPAVYFCHDWYGALDIPPRFPRIHRYVGVDETCRDKLLYEHNVSEDRVHLLLNFIDPDRFKPRGALPSKPSRALLYSNYTEDDAYLKAIRKICIEAGLRLDTLGKGSGNATPHPEDVIGQYDIVFAKGRSALEAAAMGVAVILYFGRHAGPLVTSAEVERLLPLNFGIRAMTPPLAPDEVARHLAHEIARYDAGDPARVSSIVRVRSGIQTVVDQIVGVYREAIDEQLRIGPGDSHAESRAAAAYLRYVETDVLQNAAPVKLREKIERIPLIGRLAVSLARRAAR